MSDGFEHNIKIIEAAMPCLPANARHSCMILLKAEDLAKNLHPSPGELHAASLGEKEEPADLEALMEHILPVCNPAEQSMVHQLLSFLRANKLYRSYQEYQKSSTFSENSFDNCPRPNLKDFLLSQLNPSQQETLQTFQSLIS